MRTPPPTDFPEAGTPAERLDSALRLLLTVSKTGPPKADAWEERLRESKRAAKKVH